MAGAIRPPWIDKKDFYHLPFNYCDRWCERCNLTEICKVFQDEQKSREKWIKQGKDPDSWEYVFVTVKESFEKTMRLIEKGAKKWGIDLSKIDDSDYEPPPEPEKFPLYNLVEKFSKRLEKLLKNLEIVPIETNERLVLENMEVISHYQPLIRAKIYRALTSRLEDEKEKDPELRTFDAETSAFIVVNGLISVGEALANLAEHKPLRPLRSKMVRLGKASLDLAKIINLEFNLSEEGKN
ncbi:MAG: hypothetical protein ACOZBZ_00380 [Patescibacteria group bacterium]